jgi:hypothetical protein
MEATGTEKPEPISIDATGTENPEPALTAVTGTEKPEPVTEIEIVGNGLSI